MGRIGDYKGWEVYWNEGSPYTGYGLSYPPSAKALVALDGVGISLEASTVMSIYCKIDGFMEQREKMKPLPSVKDLERKISKMQPSLKQAREKVKKIENEARKARRAISRKLKARYAKMANDVWLSDE